MTKPHERYSSIIFDIGQVLLRFDPKNVVQQLFGRDIPLSLLSKQQVALYSEMSPEYMTVIEEGIALFDAVRARGFRTYVLSNLHSDWYEKLQHKHDFFKKFDGIVISGHVNSTKPHPVIYQHLLTTYALTPEECLFIDDREDNIVAGKALGIDGIVCSDHAFVHQELCCRGILSHRKEN